MPRPVRALLVSLVTLFLLACGGGGGGGSSPVTLQFAGLVGGQPFVCGQTYTGLGTSATDFTGKDFRLYLHDFRLVTSDGAEVPLELVDDGKWQDDGVVLLDFEDGSGACDAGNADMNSQVVGRAPEGDYVGVRFRLGVPVERNHLNVSTARAPLNITDMFWSWSGGYKFLRIDGSTPDFSGYRVHVGATGCDGDMTGNATCTNTNDAELSVMGFDPLTGTIAADVAELLAGADLAANAADTPPGCMSGPTDADCAPIFQSLGLPWDGTPASAQRFFEAQ